VTSLIRPILANSCARAATAEEAGFRIDRPIGGRSALVVALDDAAADVVDRVADKPWRGARFLDARDGLPDLDDVDVVVMIATGDADADVAAALARGCAERGIMTAGLILGERLDVAAAVSALRPYARNLMVTDDEDDVAEVLTALRA
jgi:predicted ThiF/HesA family dinucleotide-utilizing enzyme